MRSENSTTYYSNGKLLLTGEYVVLDGALALALPTKYGQSLTLTEIKPRQLQWKSLDEKGHSWFETTIDTAIFEKYAALEPERAVETTSDSETARTLLHILAAARKQNPAFLQPDKGYAVTTKLNFPRSWGLGSSSTLINNIAQWGKIDAYRLLWDSFPGSGYDIACAQYHRPLLYRLKNEKPVVQPASFYPPFTEALYFIHLKKKQNSREGIQRYRGIKKDKTGVIYAISGFTEKIAVTSHIAEFETLLTEHETLMASLLELPKVKDRLFPDYFGIIKSLGAWGGDFILATGHADTPGYFKRKGFTNVIPYRDMVLGKGV